MLGLKRGTVLLAPHEKEWETFAVETMDRLRAVLGDTAVEMQHVGSTAVPAIQAKPIVDLAVAGWPSAAFRTWSRCFRRWKHRAFIMRLMAMTRGRFCWYAAT